MGDIAWLLVSSVEPERWDEVIAAYGSLDGFVESLPAAAVQGFLSMSDCAEGTDDAVAWSACLDAAAKRL